MNLLTPPTDSIYKFCGVSGLALFVYIIYYLLTPSEEMRGYAQIIDETNALNAEIFAFIDGVKYNEDIRNDSDKKRTVTHFDLKYMGTPKLGNIIYSLPIDYQQKYQNLYQKYLQLKARDAISKENFKDSQFSENAFILFMFVGEFFLLWGFFHWLRETRQDRTRELQIRLGEVLSTRCCQSCFKEFIFEDDRGTNKDGTSSKLFCSDCYMDGYYVEPELTYQDAKERLEKRLRKLHYKPRRINKALKNFAALYRWKRQTSW